MCVFVATTNGAKGVAEGGCAWANGSSRAVPHETEVESAVRVVPALSGGHVGSDRGDLAMERGVGSLRVTDLGSGVACRTCAVPPSSCSRLPGGHSFSPSPPHLRIAPVSAVSTTSHRVMSGSTALASASKLGDLLAQLQLNPPEKWPEIENTAQSLANDLRSKNGSLHTLCSLAYSMPTRALKLNSRLRSDRPCSLRP